MSHFVANRITFSKDKTTFTLKGGDNNVVPRPNNTTKSIESIHLLDMVSSRSVQFTPGYTLGLIVTRLAKKYDTDFGGSRETKDTMYHLRDSPRAKEFSTKFLIELQETINNTNLSQKYVIHFPVTNTYIKSFERGRAYTTESISNAKKFGLAQATTVSKRFSNSTIIQL